MSRFPRQAGAVWLGLVLLVMPLHAADPPPREDADLAQLAALLEAQQQRIQALQTELAAAQPAGDEAARADALRQQIREIFSDQAFRENLMPSQLQAGYDKGFFIRSSDDQFKMVFNGRMQFRWSYYNANTRNQWRQPRLDRDDRTGMDIRRLRFGVQGHAFTPDLTYLLEFQADSPSSYDLAMQYAWVNYRFADEFQFRAGLIQVAGTRASFQSSANMQFPEYPMSDFLFTLGTGVGGRFWGQLFNKRLEYYVDVVNSFNGPTNRTITPDPAELDNHPGLAFRAVWHALGDNPTQDFVSWGDIEHHETPALDLGFHYAFNEDHGDARTSRTIFGRRSALPGGFGVTTTNGLQINQFGLDAAFKFRGFSVSGEYYLQMVDPRHVGRTPFTPLALLTGEGETTTNQGAYVQTGYFLPIPGLEKKLELVARVGGVRTTAGDTEGVWTYAGGVNYYFQGNRVKLQTEVERVYEVPLSAGGTFANANDDALVFRVQLQVWF